MTKRITLIPKVICRGNARRYGLRPSGRRNALGSVLTPRENKWFSGCPPALSLFLRHNIHTGPNFRVPPTTRTHDPDCRANCMDRDVCCKLTAIAQRAQRSTTGYYTGYIQKRQPVGAFELKQATLNLQFLQGKLSGRSNAQQYHHMASDQSSKSSTSRGIGTPPMSRVRSSHEPT